MVQKKITKMKSQQNGLNSSEPVFRDSPFSTGFPLWLRVVVSIVCLAIILCCLVLIWRYIANPQSASPKELGVPTLLIFSLAILIMILVPWGKIGLRIKKIGAIEFEQVVLTQKKEQAESIDSLLDRIENLEQQYAKSSSMTATTDVSKRAQELEILLKKFLSEHQQAFSVWKIQTWGAKREGFQRLGQYSKSTIASYLQKLLVQGEVEIVLSKKGNTLYRISKQKR
jgi:hypothetical protein